MNSQRRRALELKRLERLDNARLEERKRGLRRTLDFLAAHRVPHELVWWDAADRGGYDPAAWLEANFPLVPGGALEIDWSRKAGAIRGPEPFADAAKITAWFDALDVAGRVRDCEVLLFTDNGHHPMIRASFADIRSMPDLLQLDALVWWIFSEADGWLIQFRMNEPWWWGSALGGVTAP